MRQEKRRVERRGGERRGEEKGEERREERQRQHNLPEDGRAGVELIQLPTTSTMREVKSLVSLP